MDGMDFMDGMDRPVWRGAGFRGRLRGQVRSIQSIASIRADVAFAALIATHAHALPDAMNPQ